MFINKCGGESTFQINNCISGTRTCVNLLKQCNHIWYRCSWTHHLVRPTVIYCHSPRSICLLHRQGSKVNGDVIGITTLAPFKSLMMVFISVVPPGIWCCFWFTSFLDRGNSSGFHLASPTIIFHKGQVRGSPTADYVYSNYAFWNIRNIQPISLYSLI